MLTGAAIAKAQPRAKPRRLHDAHGLYLLISPRNVRGWRWNYRWGGKRRTLSFGPFPEVGIREARERLDAARRLMRDGTDPSAVRKAAKAAQRATRADGVLFRSVLADWRQTHTTDLAESTRVKLESIIRRYVEPAIGARPIHAVDAPSILALIKPLAERGQRETAHAVKRIIGQVLRYGIATGATDRDWTQDLRGAIAPVKHRHHAAVTEPAKIGALMRALHAPSAASLAVATALKLAPLLFVRPGELRAMEWAELDLDAALWTIPAARTKLRRVHLVPLSTQAVALIREMQPFTGAGRYVFPAAWTPGQPLSESALNVALIRLGYDRQTQTPHGFRTMASTRLHELGYDSDHIEMQLAHHQSGVRGVYNQARYLPQRATMMQAWADHLDGLRSAR